MLVSTSLRAVARRGAGLCVLRAARRGCSLTVGTSEGRRWPCGRTVASSSSSAPSSSTPRPNDVPMMSLHVLSSSKHATDVLAAYFATATGLAPGDCFLLFGPVGAGKSHFSRAFIRYAMDDDELEVPSPTFLLHNSYERNERVVHHYDLYRLMDAREGEYERLDLSGSFASGVSLIEWPERLVQMGGVPAERVELRITLGEGDGMNGRHEHDQRGAEEDRDEEDRDEEDRDEEDRDEEEEVGSVRCLEVLGFGERFVDVVRTLGSHVATNGAKLGITLTEIDRC